MGVLLKFLIIGVFMPSVFGQDVADCYGPGSVAGAAIGAFLAALLLIAVAYYLRKLYWKTRKGKHLIFSTDPESVKDEFAFDNPGFRREEIAAWQHDAPTLPLGGKPSALQAEFTTESRDDLQLQKPNIRRVKLWARDFTGLGLRCSGGARGGVLVHSVLRSGPAAAAKLHPGDRIKSIKIEFTGTPLDDAVSILSLASPYPVELEVFEGPVPISGGPGVLLPHPLLKRAGSTGDVGTLEKEAKTLHAPRSPNISHSNNSTLETKHGRGGIKKITDMITSTVERNKKEKKDSLPTTLERENEKNSKLSNKSRHSDVATTLTKTDKVKTRHSTGSDIEIIQPENGVVHIEQSELQKKDYDPKKGMKFGIRVLPPNVPDDGVLKQKNVENGIVSMERKSIDEADKPEPRKAPAPQIRHETEVEIKKPVVAKRREKMAPPIPNARVKHNDSDQNLNASQDVSKSSEKSLSSFTRTDLNSSGIKRDENGIPQELPQHMLDAAKAARNNRRSSSDLIIEKDLKQDLKQEEAPKSKKSKGKAPSPPESEKNKTDDSILEQLKNVNDFLKNEKHHSSLLHDVSVMSGTSETSYNTSTPKANKTKSSFSSGNEESLNFTQDDIDDIVSKPFKKGSDSLNNFFAESKSNLSSNLDIHSIVSLNHSEKSDKGSTTIELNNSDITIHSSPLNDTAHSTSDSTSVLDDNERKAASLGDLSRFELRSKNKIASTGTLERAQSLDISADDAENKDTNLSPKKRKAMSVVESTFYSSGTEDTLPDIVDSELGAVVKHKEPRLSLNIAKTSALDGMSTFQKNRLKKGSEFGNLEDAILKGSVSSIESDKNDERLQSSQTTSETKETSDHLAKRIMDENIKVHLKLVSEFAKSTSDGSNMSSLDSNHDLPASNSTKKNDEAPPRYEEKLNYDTNIPDDMKVSRNTYVNSLERPKSDMMKKLLAKNPILNVHVDQPTTNTEATTSKETPTPMTDASKAMHQPDIVNFDLKLKESKSKDHDDFVSNIRVGSNSNNLKYNKQQEPYTVDWRESKDKNNIITISTNNKASADEQKLKSFTKSIEIGEQTKKLIPDVIENIQRRSNESQGRTVYVQPSNMSITMTQEPVKKTVSVNVAEDEFGNKVITQKVEEISNTFFDSKTEAPIQVEQVSFGIMKNPGDIDELQLEEGNIKHMDKKILEEIKKQNPNIQFTSDDPSYTKTETIILNTHLDEEQAKALMEKIKNDPNFMSQKTPEELSQLGIKIIHDLEDVQNKTHDTVEVIKTRYSINPTIVTESKPTLNKRKQNSKLDEHITEIQVLTPRTEKLAKQKSEMESTKDKIASRQRAPPHEEPLLSYELDIELLNDFMANERRFSAKHQSDVLKRTKENNNANELKKRHSDFDLPRNSHIKFRTATYESPKGTIVTSTDLENRRLSQLDQIQKVAADQAAANLKPAISAKPSNIPVKTPEKSKPVTIPSSKIPVFMSQKSLSQENLSDKQFSLPRSSPPNLSSSSGNISITSIKSSSRSPSGGLL